MGTENRANPAVYNLWWKLSRIGLSAAYLITAAGTTAVAQSVAGTNGQAVVRGTAMYRERIALQAAYSRARREPGEALLVTLEGSLVNRPRMERPGMQPVLVPERFINVWPGESCGSRYSEASLENTYWKLTRLGGKPAEIGAGGREVFMTLAGEGRRVQGFSGCNRFTGGYEHDGKRLVFKSMAGTRMACMEGMEQEAAFLKALESTASWEIRGEHLELYDGGGVTLLRFESRYMR